MGLTDDLYREIILEHFRNPRNHGRLPNPDVTAQGANPFCGDELEVTLALQGEQIQDLRAAGKGCSISQSSASMMSEAIKGKTLTEAQELARQFKAMMLQGASVEFPHELEDLQSLEGVKKYPVRIKCAVLSWNTLLEGIDAYRKGSQRATHIEGEEGERPNLTQQMTSERLEPEGATAASRPEAVAASKPEAFSGVGPASGAEDLNEQVFTALKAVVDPELNMNVVDLGLIYGVDIQDGNVVVRYTLTSPGCPLGPVIKGQIQSAVGRFSWVKEVQPELVWSPPWDPRTMASEEAKMELGLW